VFNMFFYLFRVTIGLFVCVFGVFSPVCFEMTYNLFSAHNTFTAFSHSVVIACVHCQQHAVPIAHTAHHITACLIKLHRSID